MMTIDQRIKAFSRLGDALNLKLSQLSEQKDNAGEFSWNELFRKVSAKNPWFTEESLISAFQTWAQELSSQNLNTWLEPYQSKLNQIKSAKKVGVVNAGNIPLVGFHDFLSVLIAGHDYIGKNASDDPYLLPFISEELISIAPDFKNKISFTERLSGYDAVIATGSNNSARYFEYYFSGVPHIIRKNRNGIAILNGAESVKDLQALGRDIFDYFGSGCRSVSKVYVPIGYDFKTFFESIVNFQTVLSHHKYMNNYEYNSTVYLLKGIPFLQNGFLNLKEDPALASPMATLHFEYYPDADALKRSLLNELEKIQCMVTRTPEIVREEKFNSLIVDFGKAQQPELWNYSDGVDTMEFLLKL